MLAGQLIVQTLDAATTVDDVDAELLGWLGSPVVLEMVAIFLISVPSVAPGSTLKANVKIATALTGRVAIVQVIVPAPLPAGGATHVNAGPEFCTSDTKVVLLGIESVSVTTWASSGPWLIISIV